MYTIIEQKFTIVDMYTILNKLLQYNLVVGCYCYYCCWWLLLLLLVVVVIVVVGCCYCCCRSCFALLLLFDFSIFILLMVCVVFLNM